MRTGRGGIWTQSVALSRTYRDQKIRELTERIDVLSVRYHLLPPGELQEAVCADIESIYEEIRELKEPSYFESPSGMKVALGVSLVTIVSGWLLHIGVLLSLGILFLVITFLTQSRSPVNDPRANRTWKE